MDRCDESVFASADEQQAASIDLIPRPLHVDNLTTFAPIVLARDYDFDERSEICPRRSRRPCTHRLMEVNLWRSQAAQFDAPYHVFLESLLRRFARYQPGGTPLRRAVFTLLPAWVTLPQCVELLLMLKEREEDEVEEEGGVGGIAGQQSLLRIFQEESAFHFFASEAAQQEPELVRAARTGDLGAVRAILEAAADSASAPDPAAAATPAPASTAAEQDASSVRNLALVAAAANGHLGPARLLLSAQLR
ncbi:hypothetical protein DFJ73DRAFT_775819 [Zopfochytrium polystomum]|nr:hypothetical protein DFJ73DRAFT_775819 [Zopfochytrium polystomum]